MSDHTHTNCTAPISPTYTYIVFQYLFSFSFSILFLFDLFLFDHTAVPTSRWVFNVNNIMSIRVVNTQTICLKTNYIPLPVANSRLSPFDVGILTFKFIRLIFIYVIPHVSPPPPRRRVTWQPARSACDSVPRGRPALTHDAQDQRPALPAGILPAGPLADSLQTLLQVSYIKVVSRRQTRHSDTKKASKTKLLINFRDATFSNAT